jgi:lipoprotein NlpI
MSPDLFLMGQNMKPNKLFTLIQCMCLMGILYFCQILLAQDDSEKDPKEKSPIEKLLDQYSEHLKENPKDTQTRLLRARTYSRENMHKEAIADITYLVTKQNFKSPNLYDFRGAENFKAGEIQASIDDFDAAIKMQPDREKGHWMRGISYYYAKEYQAGQEQFEAYQDFDNSDVENAVWRFLCMAKRYNFEKAQKEILKIGEDRRVPMKQVYDLFAGKGSPDDVMKAANDDKRGKEMQSHQLFYAHQYLGLYYEALGDHEKSMMHIKKSIEHPISHYMYYVSLVHAKIRQPKAVKIKKED